MSGKEKRRDGVEHLTVDGVAFGHVLALVADRKARLLGLREMVQLGGSDFVEAVTRHGEIERMSKDYREALSQERNPAAAIDQLCLEFEAVLVEIRLRAETGRLRISRRQNGAGKPADVAGGDQQPLGEASLTRARRRSLVYRNSIERRSRSQSSASGHTTASTIPTLRLRQLMGKTPVTRRR